MIFATRAGGAVAVDTTVAQMLDIVATHIPFFEIEGSLAADDIGRFVKIAVAASVILIGNAFAGANAKGAAYSSSTVAGGAALAAAAFESDWAGAIATAVAFLDHDTALFSAAGGSGRTTVAGRLAPVVRGTAKLFTVAVPVATGVVTTFSAGGATVGSADFT